LPNIADLCERLGSYLPQDQVEEVRRLAATNILADMHMDHHCLMGALLHDVIEDTGRTKENLLEEFGETVTELVDGVSKLTGMEARGESAEERQAENFRKMSLAMSKDIRVIIVKLADRLHNMRTLGALKPEKRRRIARETLDIYAPIAQRLGINHMRIEFEDRGFEAMYPMRAQRLDAALESARGRRKNLVEEIQEAIVVRLEKEDFPAEVDGREKHLYSIYKKMRNKGHSFKDIMDVFAFRIVVERVDECYRALGIVHNLFKPIVGAFKDYIAIPKSNGYQSLHTALVGMHGVPIEVQIRTKEMDDMATYGIAAHWFYKESDDKKKKQGISSRASTWVKRLIEIQKESGDPLEFLEHVKTDLFPDEVYVFTPKDRIIELPSGSSVVDYAYALHTDIGNSAGG